MISTIRGTLGALLLFGLVELPNAVYGQPTTPPRWRGSLELTIGGENATEGADLARTSGLAVDVTGRIFVADGQDQKIRVFSSSGALVTSFGPIRRPHRRVDLL